MKSNYYYYLHFTDEEIETWKSSATCLRSYRSHKATEVNEYQEKNSPGGMAVFLSLGTTDVLSLIIPHCELCLVHCRKFNGIPDLYSLDTSSNSFPFPILL
jgi:hypothetical protein